jgi:hypothetical protein
LVSISARAASTASGERKLYLLCFTEAANAGLLEELLLGFFEGDGASIRPASR